MSTPVGFGIFMWNGDERRSNRYGGFFMSDSTFNDGATVKPRLSPELKALVGKKVKVSCQVVEARESGHIGDLFLGVFPTIPDVGENVELGVAILDYDASSDPAKYSDTIFMVPSDDRGELWIDPRKLYRLHDQTVNLFIEETDEEFSPAPDLQGSV